MSSSQRRIAFITGASRGIGRAIALALANDHELWLCARTLEGLEETRAALPADTPVRSFAADLIEPDDLNSLLLALAEAEHVDVLVNNAGVADSAPLPRIDDAQWSRAMAINAYAPFALARALLPGMAKRGHGRVVNVASTAALKGYRYTAAYSASKGAVLALTRALAAEYARKGVTVNAICPGFTDTDIVKDAVDNIVDKTGQEASAAKASLAAFSPQGRLVTPDEVAALVAYLCSDAAAAVNGQALAIDGGETS